MDSVDCVDCVVVGAGVVGLAIARSLAQAGLETLILEREGAFGTATSSRNSEVIHAGIYYPQGSLKARWCVTGKHQLYEYCSRYGVEHRRCGKLIVATTAAQVSDLQRLMAAAEANAVDDLILLDMPDAHRLEPELRCEAALLSPSTGIIDSHGLMLTLLGHAEQAGALIVYQSEVSRLVPQGQGLDVFLSGEGAPTLRARCVVNAAGLAAPELARRVEGLASDAAPAAFYAKGNYFTLSGRAPFSRLIYPVPEPGGLGVHLTLDLGGQARFGPDVEWVDGLDYEVDPERCVAFYEVIRRYWPGLKQGALLPGYSGIRPKISGPGEPAADFRIDGPAQHSIPGLINLFGIESPGLTASLAIADEVLATAKELLL